MSKSSFVTITGLLSAAGSVALANSSLDDVWGRFFSTPPSDFHATLFDMCAEHGFECESHEVTTLDGYLLTMFRIKGEVESGG